MAIDPVTGRAVRTPLFIVGAVMLIGGLVPFVVALFPGSSEFAGGFLFWVFVPLGGLMMALARLRASQRSRPGR